MVFKNIIVDQLSTQLKCENDIGVLQQLHGIARIMKFTYTVNCLKINMSIVFQNTLWFSCLQSYSIQNNTTKLYTTKPLQSNTT